MRPPSFGGRALSLMLAIAVTSCGSSTTALNNATNVAGSVSPTNGIATTSTHGSASLASAPSVQSAAPAGGGHSTSVVFRPVLAQYNLAQVMGAPVEPCINTAPPAAPGDSVQLTASPGTGPVSPAAILTPISADDPLRTVVLAENETGAEKCQIVDQLGPAFAYGEKAIKSASEANDPSANQWIVTLTLNEGAGGLDAWNAAAASCFAKNAACKQGGMAIVVDHQVISAPVPSISKFDSPTLQITGSFSKARAEHIAQQLNAGAL